MNAVLETGRKIDQYVVASGSGQHIEGGWLEGTEDVLHLEFIDDHHAIGEWCWSLYSGLIFKKGLLSVHKIITSNQELLQLLTNEHNTKILHYNSLLHYQLYAVNWQYRQEVTMDIFTPE